MMDRRAFLRGAATAAASRVLGGAPLAPSKGSAPTTLPNIIMILCDDLGYGDLGCYGSNLRTPNLDRMAAEGVRFTQFYANPTCSPSRAALLTGRYPTRVGIPRVLGPSDTIGLAEDETTLAQVVKPAGYRTMCVGKWHLGHLPRFLPTSRGFDEYFGIPYSNDMEPRLLLHNTEMVEPRADMNRITAQYTEQALRFIAAAKGSPFFLYLAHTMPHIPLGASARFRGRSNSGLYGDVVEELDWSVGEILGALKRNGLDRQTLVIFSSDNGPWYQGSPGRLRGRKGMTWEGGVREPFVARMPGRIPPGTVCHGVGTLMDILPTVARLTGAKLPAKPLDGIDIWPLLTGQQPSLEREVLLYFNMGWVLQCARLGRWKLHVSRYNFVVNAPAPAGARLNLLLSPPELYDLETDPEESYDIAADRPDVVREIQARIERLIPTFPDEVQRTWAQTHSYKVVPIPAGAYPTQAR